MHNEQMEVCKTKKKKTFFSILITSEDFRIYKKIQKKYFIKSNVGPNARLLV